MADGHNHDHCCSKNASNPSVHQTLDELDFERGIWFAAQHGDLARVRHLLARGISPDQPDSAGYTALHYASRNGHSSTCRHLLNAGASVNALTNAGRASALHRAASARKLDVVDVLLEAGADVTLEDSDGKTALHRAAESGCVGIVTLLLRANGQMKYVRDKKEKLPVDYVESDASDLAALLK